MRLICVSIIVLLAGMWLFLVLSSGGRYRALRSLPMNKLRLRRLGEPFLLPADKWQLRSLSPLLRIQRSLQQSYGMRYSAERTLLFTGELIAWSWLMLAAGSGLTLLSTDKSGLVLGSVMALLVPAALVRDLHGRVRQRENAILLALPDLLNSLVLLVGAGETVQRAIVRCVESYKGDAGQPLYKELRLMISEWESGYSFQQAFENFSRRCAVQEASLFTTSVLLNYRRGGHDFVLALRDLSRMLWDKRKAISRTYGEQASSKLVFPMVLIFLIVVILVGTPAFMMLNM